MTTKSEILACKRAIVVLQEINKAAIQTLKQPDQLTPVKQDMLTLIKVIKRLEEEAE
jgi:hypothetical protein